MQFSLFISDDVIFNAENFEIPGVPGETDRGFLEDWIKLRSILMAGEYLFFLSNFDITYI